MQIACSSRSLSRMIPAEFPLTHFPAWCGSRGIAAVEIDEEQLTAREPEYLTMLLRACERANVTVAALALRSDFTVPDADEHFRQVEHVRRMLHDVAVPLKAPRIVVSLGTADTSPAGEQRALETLRGFLPELEETGITLAVEHHDLQHPPFDRVGAIIADAHSPLIGACLDLGALPMDLRLQAWNSLAPLAKIIHARSAAFDLDGNDLYVDYKTAFAVLTEYGYDDVISILYEGTNNQYQGVLDTKVLIEKHWYHPEASGMAA